MMFKMLHTSNVLKNSLLSTIGVVLSSVALAETTQEYANNCAQQLGIAEVPGYSCSDGLPVGVPAGKPDLLISSRGDDGPSSNLDVTARLGKVPTTNPNVDAVFLCRHINNGVAALNGYILQNRSTGRSCFFDSTNKPSENVPSPNTSAGASHWRNPANLFGGGPCLNCHNNDAFIISPALADAAKRLGLLGHQRPVHGTYSLVGNDEPENALFGGNSDIHSNDGNCSTSCHTTSNDFIEDYALNFGDEFQAESWMPPSPGDDYTTFVDGPIINTANLKCIQAPNGSFSPANGAIAQASADCRNSIRYNFEFTDAGSIKHQYSGKCLHPQGGSPTPPDGTPVVFWTGCDEDRLAFEVISNGQIRHKTSQKCLEVDNSYNAPSQDLYLTTCSDIYIPQRFAASKVVSNNVKHNAGKCISSYNGTAYPSNGDELALRSNCNYDSANFMLTKYNLVHVPTGKCVIPEGGQLNSPNGTKLVFGDCDIGWPGVFYMTSEGSITHLGSSRCVHPEGGSSNPSQGTRLVLWDGCGEERIKFTFHPRFAPSSL